MLKWIKIYEKIREPTPSSQCIDLWGFNLVERMTYSGLRG
jgi:hypothetical protein